MADHALGLIETKGLIGAIEAADTMLKTADVRLLRKEYTMGGLVTVEVVGEVAAVQAAVSAGAQAAERVGQLVGMHVIPRPDTATQRLFESKETPGSQRPSHAALAEYTVADLRRSARETSDFPIQGRAITHANKQALLAYFAELG